MSWSTSELRVRLARHKTGLSPPVTYFTDRFKAVLLLWIFYVFLSYVCYAFVCVCLYMPCGHLLGKGWPLCSRLWLSNCEFVDFPLVSWVRCGTWLYRFLIFAPLLTLIPIAWFEKFLSYQWIVSEVSNMARSSSKSDELRNINSIKCRKIKIVMFIINFGRNNIIRN